MRVVPVGPLAFDGANAARLVSLGTHPLGTSTRPVATRVAVTPGVSLGGRAVIVPARQTVQGITPGRQQELTADENGGDVPRSHEATIRDRDRPRNGRRPLRQKFTIADA